MNFSSTVFRQSDMELRCTGMRADWAMLRPSASNTAVEKSRISRTTVERLVRQMVRLISSEAATSALRITSRRTGSMDVMASVSSRCQWRWVRSATSAPVAWARMVQPAGR